MRRILLPSAAAALVALAACGSDSSGSSGTGAHVTTADVQAFQTSAEDVSAAASAYGTSAATMADVGACQSDESGYEAQVRPMLDDMASHSGAMDQQMTSMGDAMDADMTCGVDAMKAELDAHHAVACASTTDMAPNRTEAARHVQAMTAWADHQRMRAEQMGSMMGMSGMMNSGGTIGTCQHNADGSYTMSGTGSGGMMR